METCKHALTEARIDAKGSDFDLDNVSTSEISEFKQFLKENEIDENDVKSVKFWQNMQGDHRFSVVVKGPVEPIPLEFRGLEPAAGVFFRQIIPAQPDIIVDPDIDVGSVNKQLSNAYDFLWPHDVATGYTQLR